jgi:hypothetical protein
VGLTAPSYFSDRWGHHMEVWAECHATSHEPRGARRACNAHSRRYLHRRKGVKLPLEVTALDVATPLTLVLDGNAAIFAITTVIELNPKVGHHDAHRKYAQWGRHTRSRWRVASQWLTSNRRRSVGRRCTSLGWRARVCR